MKINLDELKKLSKKVNIEMSDKELANIEQSIEKITDKLDDILKEDTEGYSEMRTSADVKNIFQKNEEEEMVDVSKINNYKEGYVTIEKKGEDSEY